MTTLHHYHRIHPRLRGVRIESADPLSFPSGTLRPAQVLKAYGFYQNQYAGVRPFKIGIGSLGGGFVQEDVDRAVAAWGMARPEITVRTVDAAVDDPMSDQASNVENMLDIQIAAFTWWWLTGTPADITISFGVNALGNMKAVTDDLLAAGARVVSWSWGAAASEWSQVDRAELASVFARAAALGVYCFAAAGDNSIDDGMSEPSADYPCSDPNVWSVGGTRLLLNLDGSRLDELAWGDGNPGDEGGGGGFDSTVPRPAWQAGLVAAQSGRGVPDTSANADPQSGWQISANGSWTVVGGTSAATPFTAALVAIARAATFLGESGGEARGPLTPAVYLGGKSTCNDITKGSNGDPAHSGWDPCTGLGSPRGDTFMRTVAAYVGRTMVPIAPASVIGPTLDQAVAWATRGIREGDPLQTQEQAVAAMTAGLAAGWPK